MRQRLLPPRWLRRNLLHRRRKRLQWNLPLNPSPVLQWLSLRLQRQPLSRLPLKPKSLPRLSSRLHPQCKKRRAKSSSSPATTCGNWSREVYGKGRMYTIIFEANRDLVKNPNKIYPGQILTAPKQP